MIKRLLIIAKRPLFISTSLAAIVGAGFVVRHFWVEHQAQECAKENAEAYRGFLKRFFKFQIMQQQDRERSSREKKAIKNKRSGESTDLPYEHVRETGDCGTTIDDIAYNSSGIRIGLDEVLDGCPPLGIHQKQICAYYATLGQDDTQGFPCSLTPLKVPPTIPPRATPGCLQPCPVGAPPPAPYPIPAQIVKSQSQILAAAASVGRLEIKSKAYSFRKTSQRFTDATSNPVPYFWSTGVVVAPGVIATSCHAIDPLIGWVNGARVLIVDEGQQLLIDFGEDSKQHYAKDEFEIKKFLGCSETEGLDVALLQVSCSSEIDATDPTQSPLPPQIVLDDTRPTDPPTAQTAIIGYADLDHPIDQTTADVFAFYKTTSFAKFVSPDFVVKINQCIENPKILLDSGTTTVGESGAIVFSLDSYKAVGFHSCCSAFFSNSKGKPPHEDLACSHMERSKYNQAVSSWSVLQDQKLSSALKAGCPKPSKE